MQTALIRKMNGRKSIIAGTSLTKKDICPQDGYRLKTLGTI